MSEVDLAYYQHLLDVIPDELHGGMLTAYSLSPYDAVVKRVLSRMSPGSEVVVSVPVPTECRPVCVDCRQRILRKFTDVMQLADDWPKLRIKLCRGLQHKLLLWDGGGVWLGQGLNLNAFHGPVLKVSAKHADELKRWVGSLQSYQVATGEMFKLVSDKIDELNQNPHAMQDDIADWVESLLCTPAAD